MADPIVLDPVDYWKLRAALGDVAAERLAVLHQQRALEAARARVRTLLMASGLTPEADYHLDDATFAVVPSTP